MSIVPIISFTGGEISPYLHDRIDLETYHSSCKYMDNFIPTQYGVAKRRPGLRFVAECKYDLKPVRLIPFVFSTVQAYALEFGDKYMRVHCEGGTVLTSNGSIFELATPYDADDLELLHYTQSADCLFIVHHKYPPVWVTRKNHDNWEIQKLTFTPKLSPDSVPVAEFIKKDNSVKEAATHRYAITLVDEDGMESGLSQEVEVKCSYSLNYENYVKIIYTTSVTPRMPSNIYGELWKWQKVSYINVYRNINGFWCYTGRAKNKKHKMQEYIFIDNGTYLPVGSKNPPEYKVKFCSPGNYPRTVTFDTNRLVFGGTDKKPNTIWGSGIGNYRDFAEYSTPTAVSPYEYILTTDQVNSINWIRSTSRLLVGTAGAEWRFSNLRADSPHDGKRSTAVGSKYMKSLGVSENTLFVSRVGRAVHSFAFNYKTNDYISVNLCLFAEHLFRERSIKDWAYSAEPFSIVWCVCDDGAMLNMVYNPGQEVTAWSRTTTRGSFKSVCCVPSGDKDDTYVVVERIISGKPVMYVEMMAEDFSGDIENAFYVDCGCSFFSSTNIKELLELEYLEGCTVDILADGAVQPSKKVTGGKVVLEHPAKIVHVGLGYESILETLEIEGGTQDGGISQSRQRRIVSLKVKFDETVGGSCGTGEDDMQEIPIRDSSLPAGKAVPPFSGYKEIKPGGGFKEAVSVRVKQTVPLPMTVAAIYPRVSSVGK